MKAIVLLLFFVLTYAFETKNENLVELQQQSGESDGVYKILCLLFGLLIFGLVLICSWYNETSITEHRLKIAYDICESVSCEEINSLKDGCLIHINGKTESNDVIHDPDFGLTLNRSIKLSRQVEMLQWKKRSTKQGNRTFYYYDQEWDSVHHDSETFCFGYINNRSLWHVQKKEFLNPKVTIGAFELSESLKQQVTTSQIVQISRENVAQAQQTYAHSNCIIYANGEYIMFQQSQGLINVGDLRVKFLEYPFGDFTVLSQQQTNSFTPWKFREGNEEFKTGSFGGCCNVDNPFDYVDLLLKNKLTKLDAFQTVLEKYEKSTYCGRFCAHISIAFGISLLLFPQKGDEYTAENILVFWMICLILCIPVTLLIIGVAWVFYYPKKGSIYIIISLALFGLFYLIIAQEQSE